MGQYLQQLHCRLSGKRTTLSWGAWSPKKPSGYGWYCGEPRHRMTEGAGALCSTGSPNRPRCGVCRSTSVATKDPSLSLRAAGSNLWALARWTSSLGALVRITMRKVFTGGSETISWRWGSSRSPGMLVLSGERFGLVRVVRRS